MQPPRLDLSSTDRPLLTSGGRVLAPQATDHVAVQSEALLRHCCRDLAVFDLALSDAALAIGQCSGQGAPAACRHKRKKGEDNVMAKIIGAIATSHTPTIGFAYDRNKQARSGLGADLRGLQADPEMDRRQEARRAVHDLQRSCHLVLLRSLFGLRARHRRRIFGRRRRRRRACAAAGEGPCRTVAPYRCGADGRRIRHVLLPGQADRSRHVLAVVDDGAAPAAMAGLGRAAAGRRAAIPDPLGDALLEARSIAAARDRELSRGPEGCDRCDRRAVASGAWRARGLQQHRMGRAIPRSARTRSGEAHAR